MSSHALLLRLFLSSSFFSVHVALKYLLLYADNIGITYYLTRRLRELDVHELRDVWGFICHLLVTRPTKSRALECFVIEIAQRSTHIALVTLWFMQATLHDLSTQRDSPSFVICQRVLHKCHEIVFGDQLLPSNSPYSGFTLPAYARRRKIKHHAEPVFVGIGVMLAGAPAVPQLAGITGQVAIEQGRVEEESNGLRSLESNYDDAPYSASTNTFTQHDPEADSPSSLEEEPHPQPSVQVIRERSGDKQGSLLTRRRTLGAQTLPALPLHLQTIRKSRQSLDPLGQLDSDSTVMPHQSSPSLVSARTPARSAAINRADLLLERYDAPSQVHLLRGHYYSSEVQFLLSLENICNRLVIVPKPARVSALRAELTALNHKLPAEVCMPMWCSSADATENSQGVPEPHHRIVRIPPGEAVVLNSAERAPYLLLVEILNGDLDFDPAKRSNKEILRKVVTKEVEQRGSWLDFGLASSSIRKDTAPNSELTLRTPLTSIAQSLYFPGGPTTAASCSSAFSNDEEEIDLVEQLYGDDQPLRSRMLDIEDSIVLPPTPKNRELDMATWARSSPLSVASEDPRSRQAPSFSRTHSISASIPQIAQISSSESEPTHMLSLDEYSDRMRTAAIMLAQLNADQGRESAAVSNKANGSPKLDNILDRTGRSTGSMEISQPVQGRMRLPRAEASAIRDRIMKEMLSLEEERMERMKGSEEDAIMRSSVASGSSKTAEDEGIIRRELNKVDPSAVVFSESWATKKSRIRHGSPYGHLANWDCVSVIVKTGGDLRQEQLAVQLIREFQCIWTEEKCPCWVKYFRILITGATSGLVETITDAVSIHSIKKAEYAKRLASGRLGHVTLLDHFISTYGEPKSAKFVRAQRNFAKSLAGYSIVTYLLQVKDRHNGNILIDRDGHLIHIDFGFILSNTPGNIGFEAAPFKLPPEYVEVLGGINGPVFLEFQSLFRQGFEAARKHCDRIITLVELMQKDSMFPCFAVSGDQTANQLRDRFQPTLTHALIGDYVNRLIDSSLGSHWTRLYDSYQYYSQSIL
ncbi:hypothetical protein GALMADRAFT_239690 [Galerina marginata CBS 339.88]|uniref:1-phosphatidylinositol 4-kinase n=1 Tax=Galerina marginata (strain CBS 339.88) TaxID=685588 RepID=A0A067TEH9_GALM3|nr:hypothetical protein GALMADRAFT_239690 [Galerina marginata CBS 339.88]